MMRGTEGAAEGSTSLTISHKGVGKEKTSLGRKAIGNLTSLTHEAVLHLHRVIDRATVTDDRVLTDNACTNEYRSIHRRHHRTLREAGGTTDLTVALDDRICDILGIDDLHVVADIATIRTGDTQFILDHLLECLAQALIIVMLHHKGGQLRVQFAEDGHVAVTHLVEHTDDRSFTKGSVVGGFQRTDIRDITVVANSIVVDIVAYLLYQTVIADSHIAQRCIINA